MRVAGSSAVQIRNDHQSEDGQGAVAVPLSLQQIADEVIE